MVNKRTKTGNSAVDKALDEVRKDLGGATRAQVFLFGASDLVATANDRYLYPGWEASAASTTEYRAIALHDGVLTGLRVFIGAGGDTSGRVTLCVRVNGKDTTLTIEFEQKASGSFAARAGASVAVKAGDTVSVVVRKSAAPTTAQTGVTVQFELEY